VVVKKSKIVSIGSLEFARNVSAARRLAEGGGTVIITKRGEPAYVLLNIKEYLRLTENTKK
jgi:PHD/YefM family antitoxin component YafN of YafNO toxin-antitoxin module